MKLHTKSLLAALAACTALAAGSANAAVIAVATTQATNGDPHVGSIAALDNDLLETQGSIEAVSYFNPEDAAVVGTLTDGAIATGFDANRVRFGDGDSITYALDTSVNTLGYDITSISTITFWSDDRTKQNYTVEIRTVGGSFTELYTFNESGSFGSGNTLINKVTLTDDGGVLASGIDGIKFVFADAQSNLNWSAYREIDVVGSATVIPEPGSLALMGLGGLCVLRRRRG